jgi:hypothetical protein
MNLARFNSKKRVPGTSDAMSNDRHTLLVLADNVPEKHNLTHNQMFRHAKPLVLGVTT